MELTISSVAFMEYDKVPYTLSNIIAEGVGLKHHTITRVIRRHKGDFEEFGRLNTLADDIFNGHNIQELDKKIGRGRPEKIYKLNEDQAILLITYLKNTDIVRAFKKALVREFRRLKEEVTQFQIQRAIEKPLRRTLTDAISTWEHGSKWSYKHITDLLYRCVTGMAAIKLKAARGHKKGTGLDLLEVSELEHYRELESIVIALIGLNWTYESIKNELLNRGLLKCI
ncbi:MAG: Rha family transcriptional regulator [Peptostreptococcus sp.]|uniref:Rha family transcriptional regulator n=1 Tax=Peptostreptococcus sp. TaxID=1262 RepID=UPI00290D3AEC|nr:Rha family transcriptional regulator [Peptostreptococcus sp.]MDU5350434.1 Rha family transcriptional regulator [Peptostreptococcus sp.]MDU5891255.1 Rha family transcriptional regulator [Peptostreptococcus sp.]